MGTTGDCGIAIPGIATSLQTYCTARTARLRDIAPGIRKPTTRRARHRAQITGARHYVNNTGAWHHEGRGGAWHHEGRSGAWHHEGPIEAPRAPARAEKRRSRGLAKKRLSSPDDERTLLPVR
jgi:hypothetical protein